MPDSNYIPPLAFAGKFTCPHCAAISNQRWQARDRYFGQTPNNDFNIVRIATCDHCEKYTMWHLDQMVFPDQGAAPPPNSDMPDSVKTVYLEAASIMNKSPRGAAGLLRLGVQLLCQELGKPGNNINSDIASLVGDGLPEAVQQSLDIVRVTGNNAVHPGQIDTDDVEVVSNLFSLINVIVEYMISLPNRIGGLYTALPQSSRDAIERRDAT